MPHKFRQVISFWICQLPRGDLHETWSSQLCQYIIIWPDVQSAQTFTLYPLTSVCIFSILFSIHFLRCWRREFVYRSREYLVGDNFLHSHDVTVWYRGDIVRRNKMLYVNCVVLRQKDKKTKIQKEPFLQGVIRAGTEWFREGSEVCYCSSQNTDCRNCRRCWGEYLSTRRRS